MIEFIIYWTTTEWKIFWAVFFQYLYHKIWTVLLMNSRKFKFQVWKKFESNFAFFNISLWKWSQERGGFHINSKFQKFWEKLWKWWSVMYSVGYHMADFISQLKRILFEVLRIVMFFLFHKRFTVIFLIVI